MEVDNRFLKGVIFPMLAFMGLQVILAMILPYPWNNIIGILLFFALAFLMYRRQNRKRRGYGRNDPRDKYYKKRWG